MYYALMSFKHWCINSQLMANIRRNMKKETRDFIIVYVTSVYLYFMNEKFGHNKRNE
jgi:hypothetical protein